MHRSRDSIFCVLRRWCSSSNKTVKLTPMLTESSCVFPKINVITDLWRTVSGGQLPRVCVLISFQVRRPPPAACFLLTSRCVAAKTEGRRMSTLPGCRWTRAGAKQITQKHLRSLMFSAHLLIFICLFFLYILCDTAGFTRCDMFSAASTVLARN